MDKSAVPFSEEYERAILQVLINYPDTYSKVVGLIDVSDFYSPLRRDLFQCIKEFSEQSIPIDIICILEKFSDSEKYTIDIVQKELTDCLNDSATQDSIEFYCGEVARFRKQRELYRKGTQHLNRILEKETDLDEALLKMYDDFIGILGKRQKIDIIDIKKYCSAYFELLEKRTTSVKNGIVGLPTGFIDIDLATGGLRPPNYIIVAARPGVGKSILCKSMALNIAKNTNTYPLIFSLEMSLEEYFDRMLSETATVDHEKISRGNLNMSDWGLVGKGMNKLFNTNILCCDKSSLSFEEIRLLTQRAMKEYPVSIVFIDHIQLLRLDYRKGSNKTTLLGDTSIKLKQMAKDLNIPVVALSQLSRECEKRQDHRPILSDLKDSGIEMDADMVLFIYRDELYNKNTEHRNMADIICAKHRNGTLFEVTLQFQGMFSRFVSRLTNEAFEYDDITEAREVEYL